MITHSIKEYMFMAGDTANHDVFWSELSQSWVLENERDGFIMDSAILSKVLDEMQDRALIPACNWTIADNPYN